MCSHTGGGTASGATAVVASNELLQTSSPLPLRTIPSVNHSSISASSTGSVLWLILVSNRRATSWCCTTLPVPPQAAQRVTLLPPQLSQTSLPLPQVQD